MNYVWHLLIMVGIYVVLSSSLNLAVGYTGLLSLCHAAFFGVGAYITALLMRQLSVTFPWALLAAMIITAVLGTAVAMPAARLRGDDFVLSTLGFQVIVFSALYNLTSLTGGPNGIVGIPIVNVGGLVISTPGRFFTLTVIIVASALLLLKCLSASSFGRTIRAIRDDEIAAASLGKNVPAFKVASFGVSAAFAAVAGGIYATYMRYIDPTSFTVLEAVLILSMVVIGGSGSFVGPIIGAAVLVILPEALRLLQMPSPVAANARQVIYGALLVVLMRFRPKGLTGEYDFR